MSLKTLESVAEQTGSTVRNIAGGAVASARREISVTDWANRLMAGAAKKSPTFRGSREEGVYILSAEDVRRGRRMDGTSFVTPDGYVRRSPVQELVVDPGYRRRLVFRALTYVLAAAVAALVLYALVRFGIIGL